MTNQEFRNTSVGLIPKLVRHWLLITIVSFVIYVIGRYLSSIIPSSIGIFVDPFTIGAGIVAVGGVLLGTYRTICSGRVKNDITDLLSDHKERTIPEIREPLRQDSRNWFLCGDLIKADWWFRNLLRDMSHLEYSISPGSGEIYKIPK